MGGGTLISNYITDDNGNRAKALLSTFKKGVSNNIIKVNISYTDPEKSDKDGKEDADKHNKDSKEAGQSSNNNDNLTNSGKKESYSIMESYLKLMPIFEEGSIKPSTSDNKDKKNDNKEDEESSNKEFEIGSTIYVTALLENQGYTVWHIGLSKNVDTKGVIEAIKSKAFSSAYTKAKGQLKPLSAATYIYPKIITPFIGRCRYAIDSGSEDTESDSNTIAIAVAPINGVTNKPSENTVYKTVYNIKGDISGGGMSFLNKLKDNDYISQEDLPDGDDTNTVSGIVSNWLHKKFKSIGDSSMYDSFLKILKFVDDQVSAGNLEYNKDESDTVLKYSKDQNVNKSLITY